MRVADGSAIDQRRSENTSDVDVAVVGAGPAGLYVAWRLLQNEKFKSQRICIFDAAARIGGRVLSVTLPKVPYIVELGAMRYVPDQILIKSLVEDHFRLETAEFHFETTGYLLRGQYLDASCFTNSGNQSGRRRVPYRLDRAEKGKNPFELIVLAIQKALANVIIDAPPRAVESEGLSIAALHERLRRLSQTHLHRDLLRSFNGSEWRLIKRCGRIANQPLYRTGFWDLVRTYLSPEGYNLARDGSGYQSILRMWNAAEAIVWYLADFASSPYRTILAGMSTLTNRLYDEIHNIASPPSSEDLATCNLGWQLTKIERQDGNRFALTFSVGELLNAGITERLITARRVILALPQPALKALEIKGLEISKGDTDAQTRLRFNALLDSVKANPLLKIFILYDAPWWRAEEMGSCFRVFTDLPLRQIYHFGKDRQCPHLGTDEDQRQMCMVLAYSDDRYAEYWETVDKLVQEDEDHQSYAASFRRSLSKKQWQSLASLLEAHGTNDAVLGRVQNQLAVVTEKDVPAACTILMSYWTEPPYWAGWHSWNMGSPSWGIAQKMVKPFLGAEVYTCGEAFSSEQGWIEGALKSAERVLAEFGVEHPTWVNKDKYAEERDLWL